MNEDLNVDVTVNPEDLDTGALKILKIIRPEWEQESVVRKPIGDDLGTVNFMYRYVNTKTDDVIVIRVFGEGLNKYMDRDLEIKAHRLLSDLGIGPELFCSFNNGFFCAFVEGKTYSTSGTDMAESEERRSLKLAKAGVRELAICHSQEAAKRATEKYGVKKTVIIEDVWDTFIDDWGPWMGEVLPIVKRPDFPSKEEIRQEFDMVKKMIRDLNLPLVFCHNDFHPGNVIYNQEKDRVTLIDLEFCSFYYAQFDLAFYLFYSAFGLGMDASDDPPPAHPREYQRAYLKEYLNALSRQDKWLRGVTENDVDELQKEVDIFFLLVLLVHIPVLLMIAAKPAQNDSDSEAVARGCLKAWKMYLTKRKEFLGS